MIQLSHDLCLAQHGFGVTWTAGTHGPVDVEVGQDGGWFATRGLTAGGRIVGTLDFEQMIYGGCMWVPAEPGFVMDIRAGETAKGGPVIIRSIEVREDPDA